MTTWRQQRKDEKRAARAAQEETEDKERRRLENRSMFERIEEATSMADMREILHEFADRLGYNDSGIGR